jgi:hypothetical protein
MQDIFEWRCCAHGPHEVFRQIDAPTHTQAKKFMEFWNSRSPDGIRLGRDVPSRRIACLLSSILIWEPVDDWSDLVVRHAGEAIEHRFGVGSKGKRMSGFFSPEEFPGHLQVCRGVADTGAPVVLDSILRSDAVELMHFEVVILPIIAENDARWGMACLSYFR